MRLVQFIDEAGDQRVGLVDGHVLRPLRDVESVYALAMRAIAERRVLSDLVEELTDASVTADYAGVERDRRLLVPINHPDPYRMHITGTGLTHLGSASLRSGFHGEEPGAGSTDSARLFRAGLERGKPGPGEVGVEPEWFYKGTGHIAVASGGDVPAPAFGESIGEEAEIAGVYVVASDGRPWRVGFTLANDVSDHDFEGRNYMYIAPSKLRACPLGPELLVGSLPEYIEGRVLVLRDDQVLWEGSFASGEGNMCHSVANLEHHHFKNAVHRRPGDVHVHVFGCDRTSGEAGVRVQPGDWWEIDVPAFGRPQRARVVAGEPAGHALGVL